MAKLDSPKNLKWDVSAGNISFEPVANATVYAIEIKDRRGKVASGRHDMGSSLPTSNFIDVELIKLKRYPGMEFKPGDHDVIVVSHGTGYSASDPASIRVSIDQDECDVLNTKLREVGGRQQEQPAPEPSGPWWKTWGLRIATTVVVLLVAVGVIKYVIPALTGNDIAKGDVKPSREEAASSVADGAEQLEKFRNEFQMMFKALDGKIDSSVTQAVAKAMESMSRTVSVATVSTNNVPTAVVAKTEPAPAVAKKAQKKSTVEAEGENWSMRVKMGSKNTINAPLVVTNPRIPYEIPYDWSSRGPASTGEGFSQRIEVPATLQGKRSWNATVNPGSSLEVIANGKLILFQTYAQEPHLTILWFNRETGEYEEYKPGMKIPNGRSLVFLAAVDAPQSAEVELTAQP